MAGSVAPQANTAAVRSLPKKDSEPPPEFAGLPALEIERPFKKGTFTRRYPMHPRRRRRRGCAYCGCGCFCRSASAFRAAVSAADTVAEPAQRGSVSCSALSIAGVNGIGSQPCVVSQIMSHSAWALTWQPKQFPPNRLTTSAKPRLRMTEPLLDTSSSKNSQSRVTALNPGGCLTITSVGTSCTTEPGGYTPPVLERATLSVPCS